MSSLFRARLEIEKDGVNDVQFSADESTKNLSNITLNNRENIPLSIDVANATSEVGGLKPTNLATMINTLGVYENFKSLLNNGYTNLTIATSSQNPT